MEEYISKAALVAEINQRIEDYKSHKIDDSYHDGLIFALEDLMDDFINTLEVKEVDLEKDIMQIFSLYYEGIKHYEDIIKEEREENGGSDLAIKIMDGVVDARELGIQYVIDKLKAQKGEKL